MATQVVSHGNDHDYVAPGIYEHFKGKRYRVVDVAIHSETRENMVIYEGLYGNHPLFVRPLRMWNDQVAYNGKVVPRMRLLASSDWDLRICEVMKHGTSEE